MMRFSLDDSRTEAVSVVIPCFNARTYVGEAINSVLTQLRPGDEVIVVDDGSTDDSMSVIASFSQRVHAVRQRNQGISGARNTGLMHCTRETIAFLDADDLWPEGSLELRRRTLANNRSLGFVWGVVEAFISPELDAEARGAIGVLPPTRGGRLAGTMLVKRRVFEHVGGFDRTFHVGETMDWVARADAAGVVSEEIDAVLLRRRLHGANTMVKQQRMQSDYLRVLRLSIERKRTQHPA
jgi:glycosyltransferase involved in cell wall biosynthesis